MRRLTIVLITAITACGGDGSEITAPTAGSLEIRTTTTGGSAGEYSVSLDGGPAEPIGPNATITLSDLSPGSHQVQLGGLPEGCTVADQNPRPVVVTAGSTITVVFVVTCGAPSPTTGTLRVVTTTTGPNQDQDGYAFSVDAQAPVPIGATATVTVTDLPAGSHSVTLTGIAPNCAVGGANPQTVTVAAGATADVTFAVTCAAPAPGASMIAFSSNAVGLQAIFVVNPDGTGLRQLSPDGAFDVKPVWSPDGQKILFGSGNDLYVMNADGSARVRVAEGDFGIPEYRWSPDGSRIAFVVAKEEGGDLLEDLWVMQADGSGKTMLVENAASPTWSADGRQIAYASDFFGDSQIHIINSDGTGDTRLTDSPAGAFQPAWSPDGVRIAFVTIGEKDILLINPDGTGLVNLTQGGSNDDSPVWSPDGSKLAFNSEPNGQPLESEIAVMNRDGSGRVTLTSHPGFDISPDWSPDGGKIVYSRSDPGDSEVYVMNADGAGQTNVSNRPQSYDTSPNWGGQQQVTVASRGAGARAEWLRIRGLRRLR